MSKRTFFLAFVLAGVITATALPTANDNWVVRQQSIGPVKIGMTISQPTPPCARSSPSREDNVRRYLRHTPALSFCVFARSIRAPFTRLGTIPTLCDVIR